MNKEQLGEKIKEIRKSKKLTQEKLSEMADIGPIYLGEIERGLKLPSMKTFIKLAEALEVSADCLLCNEISTGKEFVFDELTKKLEGLTPQQRKTASDILNAYISNL